MRENIRLKQAFQFSLGVKQVVGALVASLVVLGAIFALGLGVGRKSGPPAAQPAGARDALARLDEPLTGKEEAAPELKAHQALTDNRAIEKTMPIPTANAVAKAAAEEPAAPEQDIVMPPPIAAPGPAPLPPSASSAVTASPPSQPREPSADRDERGRRFAPAAEAPAIPTPTPTQDRIAKSTSPGSKTPARAAKPSAMSTRHAAKETKPAKSRPGAARAGKATAKGPYTIQIASAQHRADAERVAKRVAARRPRIVAADVPGRGRWYRVQIGSYATRESAKLALASMPGVQGVVTPAR